MREEVQRFPVLKPGAGWIEDSVWDCTQSFFAEKGPAVTAGVLAQASDIGSMGRYLRRSVRNFLIGKARETPVGAVRRKIEELLASRAGVLSAQGFANVTTHTLWETRRRYASPDEYLTEIGQRTGRSILHELSDPELAQLVEQLRLRLPDAPLVERDRWTIWRAERPAT